MLNNMFTPTYTRVVLTTLLAGLIAAPAMAENSRERRIREMGFIPITEVSAEDIPAEKIEYVPVPKVMDIPQSSPARIRSTSNDRLAARSEADVSIEVAPIYVSPNKNSAGDPVSVSTVSPSGNLAPIIVSPKGSEIGQVQYDDPSLNQRFKAVATAIWDTDEPRTRAVDTSNPIHRQEARNYYGYDERSGQLKDGFQGAMFDEDLHHQYAGGGVAMPVGQDGYHYDYEKPMPNEVLDEFEPYPTIDLDYTTRDKGLGLPLFDARLQVTGGYRVDDLDWNIAADLSGSVEPNILSELTWSDLQMFEVKGRGELVFSNIAVVDFKAGYAWIVEGENQDSDYFGNNRTQEFSRSLSDTDDGDAWDLSLGGGVRIAINQPHELFMVDRLWLTLLAGYSQHSLDVQDKNLNQIIPDLGNFVDGLDSRYNADWEGPWLGIQLDGANRNDKLYGYFRIEYHFPDYEGDATWNLREDFAQPLSFEHWSDDGWGIVFDMGGNYQINDIWNFGFSLTLQDWQMDPGLDRVYFSNGTSADTRLNQVNWDSLSIGFGLTARF